MRSGWPRVAPDTVVSLITKKQGVEVTYQQDSLRHNEILHLLYLLEQFSTGTRSFDLPVKKTGTNRIESNRIESNQIESNTRYQIALRRG
jgi:hypothetical protein